MGAQRESKRKQGDSSRESGTTSLLKLHYIKLTTAVNVTVAEPGGVERINTVIK